MTHHQESKTTAVLRGDDAAAYALADLLIEERNDGVNKLAAEAVRLRTVTPAAGDGFAVYRWPEFQAFCRRAGFLWDLRTIDMVITIKRGEQLRIDHSYIGSDNQIPNPPESIDTTNTHNENIRTASPPSTNPAIGNYE